MDLKWLVFYLGVAILILIIVVFTNFWQAVHPPKYLSNQKPSDFGWEFEDITLTTSDNLKLAGWFVPAKKEETKSAIILLHGYPFDKGNL